MRRPAGDAGPEKRGFGPAGDRLTISSGSGELTVRPSDVDEIEVKRWFTGWSLIGAKTRATWELSGETLTLATDCASLVIGRCDVRYEVLVPRHVALTVGGTSGQITASGFDKALRIDSDNGAIRVEDASGPLSLGTSSGELRALGITSGRVTAESENGEIHLSFTGVPDQVEATADNGTVTVELPDASYNVTTTTDSSDVRTDVPKDPGSPHAITVRTDNGAINVRTTGRAPHGSP